MRFLIFSPIYRAFREAANSHALERVACFAQFILGRFNVLIFRLKPFARTLKRPFVVRVIRATRSSAWLFAALQKAA